MSFALSSSRGFRLSFLGALVALSVASLAGCDGSETSGSTGGSGGSGGPGGTGGSGETGGTGGSGGTGGTGGGLPPGTAHVDGTIDGSPFAPKDTISAIYENPSGRGAFIFLSEEAGYCSTIKSIEELGPNERLLALTVTSLDVEAQKAVEPQGPGTFEVLSPDGQPPPSSTDVAAVEYIETDAAGKLVNEATIRGQSGTLTLTSATPEGTYSGEGDVTMENGDHLTFEFASTYCAGINGGSSNPPQATPAGAFSVSFGGAPPGSCQLAHQTAAVGDVDATQALGVIEDGQGGVSVSCSILGSAPFTVKGHVSSMTGSNAQLDVTIPAIGPDATEADPAKGTVSLSSVGTGGLPYTGSCDFHLVPGTDEEVSSDRVWVAFTCAGLSASQSTCAADEGYLLLQGCEN